MAERFVLVLAGGLGERFWPWSRPDRPKQLLPLARGGRSLLASTLERALVLAPPERVVVMTARRLTAAVGRECGGSGVRVLGEPVARNTAAAIGAAAVLFEGEARGATFMAALEASRPALAGPLGNLSWTGSDEAFERQLEQVFPSLESISVDYAVLEHAPNVLVLEASFDWDDLGSWSAWARRQPHD